MPAPVLREHANGLFNCLQSKFLLRSNWQSWKADDESLAISVSDYAEVRTAINDYTYTCGASLSDLGLPR